MDAGVAFADVIGIVCGQVGNADEESVAVAAHAVVNAAHGAAAAHTRFPHNRAAVVGIQRVAHPRL